MTNFLSEAEEVELRKIVHNEVAMTALKKMLLQDIYAYGTLKEGKEPDPLRNFACSFLYDPVTGQEYHVSNQDLGERLRASLEGIRLVHTSFNKLEKFKQDEEPKKEELNPAR
jgi:hypothetical protein